MLMSARSTNRASYYDRTISLAFMVWVVLAVLALA
jgi:hypothetical protein